MSKYYVKRRGGTQPKNNAEKAAFEYFRTLDGILLSDSVCKDDFIKDVRLKIDKINIEHRRCRDVRFETWNNGENINISVGNSVSYLNIYKVEIELARK